MKQSKETESYDEEPVYYCKRCLSLSIKSLPAMGDVDYCTECGNAETGITTIDKWLEMYKAKYGHDYIEKKERKWPYWC